MVHEHANTLNDSHTLYTYTHTHIKWKKILKTVNPNNDGENEEEN